MRHRDTLHERSERLVVGAWWTVCCALDLSEVVTDADLEEARSWLEDERVEGGVKIGVWSTREAALAALSDKE